MALNDLHGMLKSDSFRFDDRMQADVVRRLVACLDDANHEVQNMAVQCLAPLVGKVANSQVQSIIDPLTKYVLTGDEKQRDIAAIGLKSVIGNIAPGDGFANSFGKSLVEKLSKALTTGGTEDTVMLEILDILTDLLTRFAGLLSTTHQTTLERLVPLLDHERTAVRKRTIQTIGSVLPVAPDTIYGWLVAHVAAALEKDPEGSTGRTVPLSFCVIQTRSLCYARGMMEEHASTSITPCSVD
jgi:cullin-associated NEDD8-dissociated protein 1